MDELVGLTLWLLIALGVVLGLLLLGGLGIEYQYRQRPGNRLQFAAGDWNIEGYDPTHYTIVGEPELINQTQALEVMVPELTAEATLLGSDALTGVSTTVTITPQKSSLADTSKLAIRIAGFSLMKSSLSMMKRSCMLARL